VEGDLAWLDGDLDRLVRGPLAGVETVIHAAGETAFVPESPTAFRAGHVDGPRALLRALAGRRLRCWVQVSTAYVCGARTGAVREDEGDVGQRFHNVYEAVKLEAETMVRAVGAERGVDVRVVRPAIVVGPAPQTAGGTPANLFLAFVRLLGGLARSARQRSVGLRIAAAPRAAFNVVPVDHVVRAVTAVATAREAAGATIHAVPSEPPTQEAMLDAILRRLGLREVRLLDARAGSLDRPSPLERRIAQMLEPYREYLEQDVRFDDRNARRLLAPLGVRCQTLDREAIGRLVEVAWDRSASRTDRGGDEALPERTLENLAGV
jgi:nucleoside-diphosphate-sugar epimerase